MVGTGEYQGEGGEGHERGPRKLKHNHPAPLPVVLLAILCGDVQVSGPPAATRAFSPTCPVRGSQPVVACGRLRPTATRLSAHCFFWPC